MSTTANSMQERRANRKVQLRRPTLEDGASLWRVAKESGTLDLNSPYAYVMWCGQFSKASVVAEVDGEVAAFVMGYRRPDSEQILFVWQVAVSDAHRGLGLASRMLDELLESNPVVTAVEATVTPSNTASRRLFAALARRHGCELAESDYIESNHFPAAGHEPEHLFHIGPIGAEQ